MKKFSLLFILSVGMVSLSFTDVKSVNADYKKLDSKIVYKTVKAKNNETWCLKCIVNFVTQKANCWRIECPKE